MSGRRRGLPVSLAGGYLIVLAVVACTSSSEEAETASLDIANAWRRVRVAPFPARWEERSPWISDDLCAVCHPVVVDEFTQSPHSLLSTGVDGWGCEACHGPGTLHEETEEPSSIDAFAYLDATRTAEVCARCHFEDLRLLEARGQHAGASLNSCTSCHAVHPGHEPAKQREPETATGRCGECHPAAVSAHLRSNHRDIMRGPGAPGCAACHTGGEEHARSLGAPGTIGQPDRDAMEQLCHDCHGQDETLLHYGASIHGRAEIGCLDCHDLLQAQGTIPSTVERCGACHEAQLSQFHLPFSHPLEDGVLGCNACHDPHQDRPSVLSDVRIRRRCEACHTDTAGPFIHEHEADRFEGCGTCHDSHGSPNRRLLRMSPVRLLCLSCHPITPANHSIAPSSPFLECVSCHTEIHGSDLSPRFFR